MNKIYRTVWNDTLRTWVAVPETAKAKGKTRSARVTAGAAVLLGASLGAPAMAADLNLLSSRLTEVPLVGSLTAALSQVATPASSGASPVAGVQVVLQSATAAAMSGISQVVSAVPTTTPVTSAPVMAFGPVEAVTAPVVAALAPVTTAAPVAAITAPIAAITAPLTGGAASNPLAGVLGTGSNNLVANTVAAVVAPLTNLVPSLTTATTPLSTLTAPLAAVTAPLTAVTEPVAAATKGVLTAVAAPLTALTTPLAQVTAPLAAVTTPLAAIAQPVTSVVSNITSPLSGVPVLGSLLSPNNGNNNTLAAFSSVAAAAPPSGSVAPTLNPTPPSGLVIGTAGLLGGVGQGLAPLTLSVFGQQEAYLRSGALAVNRENINARFSVVNVLGIPVLDLAPVTGTLGGTLGGTLPQQNLTLLGGVTSGNYITNINSGLTYNNGLLLPGTTPPSYVQKNNCLNVLGLAGATCWDVPAAQNNQVLIGDGASANGSGEVVIGTNAKHLLPNENASDIFTDPNMIGVPDTNYAARKGHSVVIGDSASGTANGQTIIGAEATSSVAGGVALGFQSVANRTGGGFEAYSGVAVPVAGAVSVGSVGRERQITNVAGGTSDTDAVNLRQLKALETQIGTVDANVVKYDDASKTTVTLGGAPAPITQASARTLAAASTIASGGTRITNLTAGTVSATSTDAVNGSQLNATNENVDTVSTAVTTLNTTVTNINNTGTKYFQANSTLAGASATGTDSIAGGATATATATNTVALGTGAAATQANSVALGAGSTTVVGAQTGYNAFALTPLQNSVGEVSVGAAGAERKITNVAAGSSDTDAANIAQLKAVNTQVSDLDKLAVKYDDATKTQLTLNSGGNATRISNVANGIADSDAVNLAQLKVVDNQVNDLDKLAVKYDDATKTVLTMNSGGVATRITNVAAGAVTATSSDVVNGSQLWGWTQDTTNVYSNTSLYNSIQTINNGGGVKYFRANSTLADAQATGANSVAVGPAAVASGASSIATGNGATAAGSGAVATGAGAVAATDNSVAVGANAKATGANATAVGANTTVTGANAVALGNGSVADRDNSVSVGAVGAERQITNVADGTADTDAANVRQVKAISGDVTNVIQGKAGMFQVENSLARAAPSPTGVDSAAGGAGAIASGAQATALGNASSATGSNSVAVGNASSASGANSTAVGQASIASGANSIAVGNTSQALSSGGMAIGNGTVVASAALNSAAIGNGSQVTSAASNSVALGNNSVADRSNTVSVGAVGSERTISNVAAGSQGTDAVNLQQLRDATSGYSTDLNNLRGDLKKYERNSYAGAASAMAVAGLPQAYTPGKSMASASVSNYLGQSAIAVGVSTITDNGRWVYKLAGNVNSQGKLGAVLGAGYQW